MVSVFMHTAPMVGTFHAAGVSAAYRWRKTLLRMVADRLDVRCVVSDDARQLAQGFLRGTYEQVFNGIEVDLFAKATPWPTDPPTVVFCSRHEERKGLRVLVDALPMLPADYRAWVSGDGPRT